MVKETRAGHDVHKNTASECPAYNATPQNKPLPALFQVHQRKYKESGEQNVAPYAREQNPASEQTIVLFFLGHECHIVACEFVGVAINPFCKFLPKVRFARVAVIL